MFTRSKNYYIHKTLIFYIKKKIETTSKRLLPKVRGEGKTVNQSADLRGAGGWLLILERKAKEALSEEVTLKHWS